MRGTFVSLIGVFLLLIIVDLSTASAAPIFPAGQYPALDEMMERHGRQLYNINAYPFGLSLDVHPADEAAHELIDQFLAQDASDDFEAVTGKHIYEILGSFGEYGDLGFFGGVALAGTAYEYMTLKREGASADKLAIARARLVRAAESWHIFYVVTGGKGIVARGIRRLFPEDPEDPPIPFDQGEIEQNTNPMPLFDDDGNPLPSPKVTGNTARTTRTASCPRSTARMSGFGKTPAPRIN